MDQFESLTQMSQDKKKNTVWTEQMDKCLIEALVYQCNEGNKIDKGFKEKAYVYAANMLNVTFNLDITKDNVINRMKTIKKGYREIERMLAQSGFTFNFITKKVDCSDSVWETYVMAHPSVKNLRHKKIEMIDELATICGNDAATGQWCRGGAEINTRRILKSKTSSQMDDDVIGVEDDGDTTAGDDCTEKNGSTSTHVKQGASSQPKVKRQGKRSKNAEAYTETMTMVASSIKQMADAIEKRSELELKKAKFEERATGFNPTTLLDALRNMEGLTNTTTEKGYSH